MARLPVLDLVRSGASFREIFIDAVDDICDGWEVARDDRETTYAQVEGWMGKYEGPMARWAVGAVFEELGLELQPDEGLNEATIRRAINEGPLAGSGVVFTNIFDRQAVIDDLMLAGMKKVGEAFGVDVSGVSDLRGAVRQSLAGEIAEQLAAESGSLFEGAPDSAFIARVLAAGPVVEGWNAPTDLSAAGQSNRERQARFRASKTRHWVAR